MEFIDNNKNYDNELKLKVTIVGLSESGKSKSITRLNSNNYYDFKKIQDNYQITVGFEFETKKIRIKSKVFTLQIWDTCGQPIYDSLIQNFYKNSNIFFIFYNSFNIESFEKAKQYFDDIRNYLIDENKICILVSSKYEINLKPDEYKNIVSDEEAMEFADKNNIYFYHISSFEKYSTGINELIFFALLEYLKKNIL